ncbi:MAG TPA: 16S rRNA (guanine(527)-N(7))-methyltransferase RsmG [Micavibrio sp.]|jgi:16S rRNA (guanine527-N7)-methyltransferase
MTGALHITHEIEIKLRAYEALLHKWQKAVNLVGPSTLPDSWVRHFEDSLQILPLLPPAGKTLYDLGSGAGFPGMAIAIARPDVAVTLIESDQKKCAFLTNVSHETKTPVRILAQRIEQATESLPPPDIITARALAPLSSLLTLIRPWVEKNPNLVCIFPKGAQAMAEIEAAQGIAAFDVMPYASKTDETARILTLRNIRF